MSRQIIPITHDRIIHNPGCGAMLLQRGRNKIRFDRLPKDAWFLREKLVDKIAFAIPWSALEPEEGKILWKQPDWEGCIDSWIDAGFKVALEVRGMDTWGTFYDQGTPQWVFDAGAAYIDEPLEHYKSGWTLNFLDFDQARRPVRYPVYWDRVYLEKARRLAEAMGERYNGRPEIEWVNQGFLGRWGEMHISDHSPLQPWLDAGLTRERYVETALELIEMFDKAFPDTRICQELGAPVFGPEGENDFIPQEAVPEIPACCAKHRWILKQNGIGMAWNGNRSRYLDGSTLDLFDRHCRETPIACENLVFPQALEEILKIAHINYWHPGGEREGLHILEHEKPIPLAEKKVWSFLKFFPEEYAAMTIEDEKNVWRMMARRCGYRLEIAKLILVGDQLTIDWRNSGSAPCFEDLTLSLEVRQGEHVIAKFAGPCKAAGVETFTLSAPAESGNELHLCLASKRGVIQLGIEGADEKGNYAWKW